MSSKMDSSFWNKFKKKLMTAPKSQPSSALQLARFDKCWHTVQDSFSSLEKRNRHINQTLIASRLKMMVDLLVDEESRLEDATGTTGVCMEYLLKNNVLPILGNISEGDKPKGILGETIRMIASMINLLDDRFLVHNAVHKPTVKLLRTCVSNSDQSEEYHEDLVDLMYIICSKIHGFPELLNVFFHDKKWLTVPQRNAAMKLQKKRETMDLLKTLARPPSTIPDQTPGTGSSTSVLGSEIDSANNKGQAEAGVSQLEKSVSSLSLSHPSSPSSSASGSQDLLSSKSEYEFLLFTYLLRFVHREGKAGDFARTGLLFLMELATGSLEEYILDSGFKEVVVGGLGALYAQLPRQLLVRGGASDINSMVRNLNDQNLNAESTPSRRANIEVSTSLDFQSRLDAFLKLLEFCQDVLMRCPSSDIATVLLASIKMFMENILYPSILECSDTDGSSVAVISYIDQILQSLEHEVLVDMIVGFLMGSDEDESMQQQSDHTKGVSESQGDAFAEMQNKTTPSPYFLATGRFTLKDLVLSRLKSRSQPTVIATLKLLHTIISRHCKYSLKLLNIQLDDNATSFPGKTNNRNGRMAELTMVAHHVHELDLFFALISTINPHNTTEIFCNGYESYLRDAEASVEVHQCYIGGKEEAADPGDADAAAAALERKKQRRRSMKYGDRLELPDDQSGEAFLREQDQKEQQQSRQGNSHSNKCTMPRHRLLPTDPLLQILLGTLSHFFAHSVELNLALTGVITALAVCPYRSLEGWLLFKSTDVKKPYEDQTTEERAASALMAEFSTLAAPVDEYESSDDENVFPAILAKNQRNNRNSPGSKKRPTTPTANSSSSPSGTPVIGSGPPSFKAFPPFFTMLKTLTQQVDYYRSEIDGFDEYLADRRRGLLVATELNSAIHTTGVAATAGGTAPYSTTGTASASYTTLVGSELARPSTPTALSSMLGTNNTSTVSLHESGTIVTHTTSAAVSLSPGSYPSRMTSPIPQRIQTSGVGISGASGGNGAGGVGSMPPGGGMTSPRARNSSSPSSILTTPSNMSFLLPPGIAKRNFRSTSNSPLGPGFQGSGANVIAGSRPNHNGGVYQSEGHGSTLSISSTSSGTPLPSSATAGPASVSSMTTGGMGPTINNTFIFAAPSPSYSASYHAPIPQLKNTDTILVKPLFAAGFVNDSDSDAELGDFNDEDFSSDEDEGSDQSPDSGSRLGDEDERVPMEGDSTLSREQIIDYDDDMQSGSNNLSDDDQPKRYKTAAAKAASAASGKAPSMTSTNSSSSGTTAVFNRKSKAERSKERRLRNASNNSTSRFVVTATGSLVPGAVMSTTSASKAKHSKSQRKETPLVTLSQLLTNVVILEEVVKEVVAVAQVRRVLGVDKVQFL